MTPVQPRINNIYCGELCALAKNDKNEILLTYYDCDDYVTNVDIKFSKFIEDITSLPPRIVDLLEIAAYVLSADRKVYRGDRSRCNNNSWARTFHFHIPVRDFDFWSNSNISSHMATALKFMTGDRNYCFEFKQYIKPPILGDSQLLLFSNEYVSFDDAQNTDVLLFSGGLDSLAGAIDYLTTHPDKTLCLVSHKSNTTVTRTQEKLIKHLKERYGEKRIKPYSFECHFRHLTKSTEETQRTRMFLFSAIAFAICHCYDKQEFFVYENGITSINFPKQTDIINARASRTTHPKTIALLKIFYGSFLKGFQIVTPYMNKTKTEILKIFEQTGEQDIIASAVSCSSTRNKPATVSHCGCCSQCIDRRFAIYAAHLEDCGDNFYAADFISNIPDDEAKQRLYITLRFATMADMKTKDDFKNHYMDEIMDIVNNLPGSNPEDKVDDLYNLLQRYGESIMCAINRMRNRYEDIKQEIPKNSLLDMIASRTYLKSPFLNRVREIDEHLRKTIPAMFQHEQPKSENDFNDKIQAILMSKGKFEREYPVLQFGVTSYKADHSQDSLLLESKYIRKNTIPSVATKGIASDITLVPNDCGLYFIVYDPERQITSDEDFIQGFENKRDNCYVRIYR
jgi:7-cyano-7-deazaguanine synthase in queuosine biosynthesis